MSRSTPSGRATAIEEFKAFKRDADRLEVPLVLTLGNHDIAPGEVEPELFWQVFDQAEHPAYQVRQVGGMPCFFLNGRHNGDIDPAQRQWLVEQAAAIDRDQEALLFVHQPALGAVVNERGIAPAIREAFAEHAGPLWLVAGHAHHNGDRVFALPRTTIVQASITTVGPGMWGGPERPGYWLYGLHGGRVAARVYHQLNGRYRVVGPPSRADAQAITEPFEHVQPRWKVLVGEGDRQWLVEHEASDVETYWFYVGKLHYRLPLGEAEGARRLALLARLGPADNEDRARVLLSGDGDDWQAMAIGQPRDGVYTWELPPELRAGRWLHVRLDAPNRWRSQAVVAGFALLG